MNFQKMVKLLDLLILVAGKSLPEITVNHPSAHLAHLLLQQVESERVLPTLDMQRTREGLGRGSLC